MTKPGKDADNAVLIDEMESQLTLERSRAQRIGSIACPWK